ncbi:MAG: DUF6178 family protein [Bdellovibrionota bacterium]
MKTNESSETSLGLKSAYSISSLRSEIFASESPESLVRSLPAQIVYMAMKESGISSAVDLFEMASPDQRKVFLDLDLWAKDRISEDNLWEWLSMPDEADSIEILQKIISVIDLKIIAYFINRYVDVQGTEEPTDAPPGPNYYSPDKGYTWISVNIESEDKKFYLSRLLALIFETNAELFYQLTSLKTTTTKSQLEEESFRDKGKRLAAEGIPELEYANENCSMLPVALALQLLNIEETKPPKDIPILSPLIYDPDSLQPLTGFIEAINKSDDISSELSLLMNSAIVSWGIDFSESELVRHTARKVRGLINIGLETIRKLSNASDLEIYKSLGLKHLMRVGIAESRNLKKITSKILKDEEELFKENKLLLTAIDGINQVVPELPVFLDTEHFETSSGIIPSEFRPLETLADIQTLEKFLLSHS